jgi:hypothetical protein
MHYIMFQNNLDILEDFKNITIDTTFRIKMQDMEYLQNFGILYLGPHLNKNKNDNFCKIIFNIF